MITDDVYGIMGAHRPWSGDDQPYIRVETRDTPEQIARCESCQKPDCTNCMSTCKTLKFSKRFDKAVFMALYESGKTDGEIGREMGVSTQSARRWRTSLGLPSIVGIGGRYMHG